MKKGLVSLVAASMLASSAMAVKIATDGTGDYLIAPQFSVRNGYTTNLKLINTDNERSFLIRGVVRRSLDSKEIFDFTVMMSPGDVWDATLADGKMISDDDSNWEGKIDQSLEGEEKGYIEFFILAELNNNNPEVASKIVKSNYSTNYLESTVNVAKIKKKDLKDLFIAAFGGASNIAEKTDENQPDLTYVVNPGDISSDAIAGFVTLENPATQTLRATIPMFAFEDTRDGQANIDAPGFIPGDKTEVGKYIGGSDPDGNTGQTAIRNLLRAKVVSVPYDLEGATKINFTYILDEHSLDPKANGVQNRTYKQVVRNMSEKFPLEVAECPENLIEFVKANYPDAADGSISPYVPPKCTITANTSLTFTNEMNSVTAEDAIKFEDSKKYTRTIVYQNRSQELVTAKDEFDWNDFDPNDYQKGMLQIHNITNIYDDEDNVQFNDGQTVDRTQEAAFIPTYFDIKYVGGNPVLNWNYAPTR